MKMMNPRAIRSASGLFIKRMMYNSMITGIVIMQKAIAKNAVKISLIIESPYGCFFSYNYKIYDIITHIKFS
jgi:hypothetical protein